MNLSAHFPACLHWTAQQLTDAVPPRLHQLFSFDALAQVAGQGAANGERRRSPATISYRSATSLPARFGIR